jgi:MFS family permease
MGKAGSLFFITLAQVLALSLWFAGTAAGPAMGVGPGFQALLTGAVQAGFVLGTLGSAVLALPDRFDPRRVFALSALAGAAANAAMLVLPLGGAGAIVARLMTGVALAGVYPVGMKLAVGWADRGDAGLVVGLLVGGLTLGSASPHLVNALGGVSWRVTLTVASCAAVVGAGLIGAVRLGPLHRAAPAFRADAALGIWRDRGTRLILLGYLGHMWELYAMWAWVGAYLAASFAARLGSHVAGGASLATFGVVAVGAVGCVAAGVLADRWGRVRVVVTAMAVSGSCCVLAGPAFGGNPVVVVALCLVWGVAVVADSAQFSAAIAARAPAGLTGTMLTVQTCAGFALTLVTIQVMPVLVGWLGWGGAFAVLAVGPAAGCVAMMRVGRGFAG